MTKSLANLEHQNFGIATANRYVLHLDPAGAGYTVDRLPALYRQIEDRFSALPGVASVGMALYSPLEGDNWGECVIQQGHPAPRPGDKCGSTWDRVSTHFLDSIGVPMVRGRGFTAQDTATSPPGRHGQPDFRQALLPQPGSRRVSTSASTSRSTPDSFEIVGVFADFKMNNPRDRVPPGLPAPAHAALHRLQGAGDDCGRNAIDVHQRHDSQLQRATAECRRAYSPHPGRHRSQSDRIDLRSFDAQVAGNFNEERLIARLTSLFGILALILASVGLYGVMSYFVARRTSEIGIRMALGATRSSVVAMVLRGALWQILVGLGLGIPAALLAGHLMAGLLYGVGGYDPLALVGATLVLGLCAAAAGFIPARRAASIEPMQALRTQ